MPNINVRLFEFVNQAVGYYKPLDVFFIEATSSITLLLVAACVGLYFGIYIPYKRHGPARIRAIKDAAFIVGALVATGIVVEAIKLFVAYPRPFQALQNIHTLIALPADYSFPSGHAAITMALATSVYLLRKRLGSPLFAFAFAVGMARIYVGVHYPLDVGIGFLVGYLIPKVLGHFFLKNKAIVFEPQKG